MDEKRKQRRFGASDNIVFCIGDVIMSGRLSDVSREGCRVAAPVQAQCVGETVEVTLLEGVVTVGAVTWQTGACIGIAFDRPIPEATVRYFTASDDLPEQAVFLPVDAFGRALPPLAGGRHLGISRD